MSEKSSISSHVKISYFTCVQIPHFSVVEILVKHCSLYNKKKLVGRFYDNFP